MSTEFIYTRVLITLPAFSLGTIFSSSYIVKIEIKAKQKGNVRLKTAGVCKYIRAYLYFLKCLTVFLYISQQQHKLVS